MERDVSRNLTLISRWLRNSDVVVIIIIVIVEEPTRLPFSAAWEIRCRFNYAPTLRSTIKYLSLSLFTRNTNTVIRSYGYVKEGVRMPTYLMMQWS